MKLTPTMEVEDTVELMSGVTSKIKRIGLGVFELEFNGAADVPRLIDCYKWDSTLQRWIVK